MGVSTRPSALHRQQRTYFRRAAAVLLFGLSVSVATSFASPTPELPDVATTQSIATDNSHEVLISNVPAGKESLSVMARLTTMSSNIAKDVMWQVRNAAGELIIDATASAVESPLAPGEYIVEAQYGAVALREKVSVAAGNSVTINFVLNAGGLRVLPALKDMATTDIDSKTLVYALSGFDKGKLVAHSEKPGELIKLVAGMYRVESRMGSGNLTSVTDVRIRPGKMSAVEVLHQAGIARLSFVGSPDAKVTWDVRPIDGVSITSLEGITQKLALKPGTYLAQARVNGEILTAKFKIVAGEERDIMLGN
jgi:hypothetical protein